MDEFADALSDGLEGELPGCAVRYVGDLILPSGRIVVGDPQYPNYGMLVRRTLPPGRYPVWIAIDEESERTAVPYLRFSDAPIVSWHEAELDKVHEGNHDNYYPNTYEVDSGTGCFTSAEVVAAWKMPKEEEFSLIDQMVEQFQANGNWGDFPFGGANIISFESGYGDGAYGSYWGLDADGNPVALMTNFEVFEME